GSVIAYLEEQRRKRSPVPDNIALPWPFSSRRVGEVPRAGPYPAFLGGAYAPPFTDFVGEATPEITNTLTHTKEPFKEPHAGRRRAAGFPLGHPAPAFALTAARPTPRRSLSEQFDAARSGRDASVGAFDKHRQMAYSLIGTRTVRDALDVACEPI